MWSHLFLSVRLDWGGSSSAATGRVLTVADFDQQNLQLVLDSLSLLAWKTMQELQIARDRSEMHAVRAPKSLPDYHSGLVFVWVLLQPHSILGYAAPHVLNPSTLPKSLMPRNFWWYSKPPLTTIKRILRTLSSISPYITCTHGEWVWLFSRSSGITQDLIAWATAGAVATSSM